MRYAVLLYQDEVVWGPATTVGAEALVGVVTGLCTLLPHEYTVEIRPVTSTSEAGDRLNGG